MYLLLYFFEEFVYLDYISIVLFFLGHKLKVAPGLNILRLPVKNISLTIWRYVVSLSTETMGGFS